MEKNQCGTCGRLKDTPNFAYHVCVPPRQSGRQYVALLGAISSAIYFNKVTQYVRPEGTAVIMSAKKYRELTKEETPNVEIEGITKVDEK